MAGGRGGACYIVLYLAYAPLCLNETMVTGYSVLQDSCPLECK